jgi:hypothetical protein
VLLGGIFRSRKGNDWTVSSSVRYERGGTDAHSPIFVGCSFIFS